jgi:hypothetical protein
MRTDNLVTIGMDVSDRWSHIAVLDEQGVVLVRDRVQTKDKVSTPPGTRRYSVKPACHDRVDQ